MIRLDSIKIEVPETGIKWAGNNMPCTTVSRGGEVISETYTVPKQDLPFGVRNIQIRHNGESRTAIVETSAKILRDQYFDMVTVNTADRYLHELNKNGHVMFTPDLITSSRVLTMDVTQNLQVGDQIPKYLSAMACVPITDKYNVTAYKGSGNAGIVWGGKQKTFKERQIFYDKLKDIARDQKLRKNVHSKHLQGFNGVLRVEGNFTSFKTIRQYTGTDNILGDILQSDRNVNIQLFDKITRNVNTVNLELLMEWDGMKLYQVEKLEGRKNIIRALDYDMVKIRAFLSERVKGNTSSYVREYRKICNAMRKERGIPETNILQEVRQYMLTA
jgi:hypothetical protein